MKLKEVIMSVVICFVIICSAIFTIYNYTYTHELIRYYTAQSLFEGMELNLEEKNALLKELKYYQKKGLSLEKQEDEEFKLLFDKFLTIPHYSTSQKSNKKSEP